MKVCVVGGGNIGTLLAAEFAHRNYETWIYSGKPDRWSNRLTVYTAENSIIFETNKFTVTNNLAAAVFGAEQIWITLPSFLFPEFGKELLSVVNPGQAIVCVPGSGGAEFAFDKLIHKGCTLCGLQRVHSIARLKEYGKSVYMLGRKDSLQVATIPSEKASNLAVQVEEMLEITCTVLPNYLNVTLTPSNPILHTSRLYSMFSDYRKGRVYDHNILFYEEWTDDASRIMLQCDEELQNLCAFLEPLDLEGVRSLKIHYESDTPEKMTAKIQSIKAFKGITSPMKQTELGWIPDFTSRYFTADFSYGLKIIYDMAKCVKVKTPMIEQIWNWYLSVSDTEEENFFHCPFNSKEQLLALYI